MSLWLKRQQPVKLYQSSDIPYVILEDGVHLCFDNCYGTQEDNADFNICFNAQQAGLKRANTYFYRLEEFPVTIPFSDIVSLNDTIIEGRIIKSSSTISNDSKSISIMKSSYIRNSPDETLESLNDELENFDNSFILVGETVDPQVRLFEGLATMIPHVDWTRTLVHISDEVCDRNDRKYCWTHAVPELSVSCYGLDDSDELIEINEIFDDIGVNGVSTVWIK